MKCPYLGRYTNDPGTQRDCMMEDCAIWSKKYGCCGVLGILNVLDKLAETLKQINSKIKVGG